MQARFSLSILLAIMATASAPAQADALTGFLAEAAARLVGRAGHAVLSTVIDAPHKESDADRRIRENAEIEKAAEHLLAQYPEDEREARRPEIMMQLTRAYVQPGTTEARQGPVRDDQTCVANTLFDLSAGAAAAAFGNHMMIESAARGALLRRRF